MPAAIPAGERAALIALYNAADGDNWRDNSGWKGNNNEPDGFSQIGSENSWQGITVSGDHVTRIFLCCNDLTGTLPPELEDLTQLQELSLFTNELSGSIPPQLGNLSQLQILYLSNNQLSGSIPTQLGNLSALKELLLAENNLTGDIPSQLGNLSNLEKLTLWYNGLSGTIPSQLGNLSKLKELYLGHNQLTGSIPSSLGNLSALTELNLGGNPLTGSIPTQLGNLVNLEMLVLGGCDLSGVLPPELGNLVNLIDFYAGDNNFTGAIPTQWGNMVKLGILYLNDNNLTGEIPDELGDLPQLSILHLDHNNFSGDIPSNLGGHTFQRVHLQENNLTGIIPPALAANTIDELNLSHNNLTGPIPPEIGDSGTAVTIDLSDNNLTGYIPADFSRLAIVEVIDLSDNNLSGPIPSELGNIIWLWKLHLEGNHLSGEIPTSLTQFTSISELDTNYNALYSNDAGLTAFLDGKSPGWSGTQTIAPTNLSAAAASSSSVLVSWTPIVYTANNGGYKVYYSTSSGGPWILAGDAAGKDSGQYEVTGLIYGTTYYFVARTWTNPHVLNKNTVLSGFSDETSITLSNGIPLITVDKSRLDFHYYAGGAAPPDQTLTLAASGLNCHIQSDAAWCGLSPESSTGGEIQVSVNTTGLAPGTYDGTISISASGAANSPLNLPVQLVIENRDPGSIVLNRNQLNFGAISGQPAPPAQTFAISSTAGGPPAWTASENQTWLTVTPSSGSGDSVINVSADHAGLAPGAYNGSISINDPNAGNSPVVSVILTVKPANNDQPPFGYFDTPIDGATVQGSIPVTGWALDDTGVDHVKIYRAPVTGETGSKIFIGDAVLVEGARPDVEQAYPDYPMNYRAGWGYMLLTNKLPAQGNDTFTLYAVATDLSGNQTNLGGRTITGDNANAVKPFGAIDTPTQGGSAGGSKYVNFGWALTPQPNTIPIDGSTIGVWIDGVQRGHPVYNQYRKDIAALFPGYNNSNGAVGYFYIDTTAYQNGVHTIAWSVEDDAGNKNGIGSRYFTIQNVGGVQGSNVNSTLGVNADHAWAGEGSIRDGVRLRRGYQPKKELKQIYPKNDGSVSIYITEPEPLEIHLFPNLDVSSRVRTLYPLPAGSTLDRQRGIFYWLPGPGFAGEHRLVFIAAGSGGVSKKQEVRVIISPF
jgi:Leucine-rich repeat (LRR) protein